MQKKLLTIFSILATVVVAACTTPPSTTTQHETTNTQKIEQPTSANTSINVQKKQQENTQSKTKLQIVADNQLEENSITPYGVESLIDRDFVGSDLTFERIEFRNEIYTRHIISYISNGIKVSGIMNIPNSQGSYPLIILNHGYIDPAVYTVGRGLKREQDYLARQGYAVLHTDYRNHGLSDDDLELEQNYVFRNYFYATDAINAIEAVKERNNPRIDIENIGMMGHSMGGGVTMHASIARPELIDAAVLYAPVHSNEFFNFHRRRYDGLEQEELDERTEKLGNLEEVETFEEFSAARYFDRIQTPIQIYHGTNDDSCPYFWSKETIQAMKKANLTAELITLTGEYHEFGPQRNSFMEGVTRFFDQELKTQ